MTRKLLIPATIVGILTGLSVAVGGMATTQLPRGLGSLGDAAVAGELSAFTGCEDLRDWYVAQALPLVGPYGLGYGGDVVYLEEGTGTRMSVPSATQRSTTSGDSAPSRSASGTNVQESGVDEPDRAKTDGTRIVWIRQSTLVIGKRTGDAIVELGTLAMPRTLANPELLLVGDTAYILGSSTIFLPWGGPIPVEPDGGIGDGAPPVLRFEGSDTADPGGQGPGVDEPALEVPDLTSPDLSDLGRRSIPRPLPGFFATTTTVLSVSLSDPSRPEVTSTQVFDGSLVSARQYGAQADATLRMVLATGAPDLDFVYPGGDISENDAKARNRALIAQSTIEDWLPTVTVDEGDPERVVDCLDVLHPDKGAGLGTLSVVSFAGDNPLARASTAITADGQTVYSSTDRLYVATSDGGPSTDLHSFALSRDDTRYVASGSVPGYVADRWSLDEYDGFLRVALGYSLENPSDGPAPEGSGAGSAPQALLAPDNGVMVLEEDGSKLQIVGEIRSLGIGERIESVRWFDDLAIVVTFRQTDPLYTIDLRDARRPELLGELKIPGFSEYLHPLGGGRLLGIGQDADDKGRTRGGQVSSFDVSTLSDPRRVDSLFLGKWSTATPSYEPRSFTWLADTSTAIFPVDGADGGGLRAIRVADDGTLSSERTWTPEKWEPYDSRVLVLADGSVVAVGSAASLLD